MNLLNEDEGKWIEANPERCQACGHLDIFHNYHCCEFCMVGMKNGEWCECAYGEIPKGV